MGAWQVPPGVSKGVRSSPEHAATNTKSNAKERNLEVVMLLLHPASLPCKAPEHLPLEGNPCPGSTPDPRDKEPRSRSGPAQSRRAHLLLELAKALCEGTHERSGPAVHAESLVLPNENVADLEALIADFYQRFQPATPEARSFLDELIYCEWILRRLRIAETQLWQESVDDIYRDPPTYPLGKAASQNSRAFTKLQYRLDATRRARLRALETLQQLPDPPASSPVNPHPETPLPEIGFVPSSPVQPEPQPQPEPRERVSDQEVRRDVPESEPRP